MLRQDARNLVRLHAMPANLFLAVGASAEGDLAVGKYAAQIAGAVHAGVMRRAEGIRKKMPRRQIRTVAVAAGNPRAADVDLAGFAVRDRPPLFVQKINLRVRDGRADGRKAARLRPRRNYRRGGHHRAFRGSVVVDHRKGQR